MKKEKIKNIQKRNYGIDLLRIIAMLMIVTLHMLGLGGVLNSAEQLSLHYNVGWLIEIAAFCGVNCYALISGYVSVGAKYKYHKIITLWFQVVFYTILVSICYMLKYPGTVGKETWIRDLFPVITGEYWYFTAYVALFFCIPFLNYLLNTMERRKIEKLLVSCIVLFSLIPTIVCRDVFYLQSGYSFVWLIVLYLIGGYLKIYRIEDQISKKKSFAIYFLCIIVTWIVKIAAESFLPGVTKSVPINNTLISYTSPTMLLAGITLFLSFVNLKIEKDFVKKAIGILGASSFSVYLIHTHSLSCQILNGRFSSYAGGSVLNLIVLTIVFPIMLYLICTAVDVVRAKLFVILKIDCFSQGIWGKITKIWEKISLK